MRVYTQGSFDLFHIGHVNLLRRCRQLAGSDSVIVAVLSDEAYVRYRGYSSTIPFEHRMEIIKSCRYVDMVIEANNLQTKQQIEEVNADIIVIGSDWATKDLAKQYNVDKEWLYPRLVYVPYTEEISSTKIKKGIEYDPY